MLTSEGGTLQGNGKQMAINFEVNMPFEVPGMALSLQVFNHLNQPVLYDWLFDSETPICRTKGLHKFSIDYKNLRLYQGNYFVRVHLAESITKNKIQQFDCCPFEVAMIDKNAPEWGWQNNVCQYFDDTNWTIV
ncbi:MAG: hypothetical protein WDM90_08380 [Ferruginibacter sp.]